MAAIQLPASVNLVVFVLVVIVIVVVPFDVVVVVAVQIVTVVAASRCRHPCAHALLLCVLASRCMLARCGLQLRGMNG